MGLKAILDSLDNVPAELHAFYGESDGKFVLDLEEDVKNHPRISALSNAYKQEQTRRKELSTKLTEAETKLAEIPEGFDAEEYLALKAKAGEGGDPDKKKADDEHLQSQRQLYEQRIANLTKKHETDLATLNEQLSERDGYIDKTTKLDVLRKSLRDVGVDPDFEDVVVDHLSPSIKVQRGDDGNRKAFVETDLGEVDVSSFVKDWSASKGQKFLSKPAGPDPKGNNGGRIGAKTITRAEFNKLDPAAQRKAVVTDKVTVVD